MFTTMPICSTGFRLHCSSTSSSLKSYRIDSVGRGPTFRVRTLTKTDNMHRKLIDTVVPAEVIHVPHQDCALDLRERQSVEGPVLIHILVVNADVTDVLSRGNHGTWRFKEMSVLTRSARSKVFGSPRQMSYTAIQGGKTKIMALNLRTRRKIEATVHERVGTLPSCVKKGLLQGQTSQQRHSYVAERCGHDDTSGTHCFVAAPHRAHPEELRGKWKEWQGPTNAPRRPLPPISCRMAIFAVEDPSTTKHGSTVNDNDNDNDTLREVPHQSNEGLALQARVSGPWPHKKESVLLMKLAHWQGVQVQTVMVRV